MDDPALQNRTRKDGDALHSRSIQVSSEKLGITAKLDLIEEKAGLTYPIEYKRGSGPPEHEGQPPFWDNDAVQVCAQGLLLEENLGVTVKFGILYYIGSKSRAEVPFDENSAPRRCRRSERSASCPKGTRHLSRCRPSCATVVSAAPWHRSASPRRPCFF